jgi:Winged helix-turn helix
MDYALWTRPAIALYILQRYGLRFPVRTLGHFLRRGEAQAWTLVNPSIEAAQVFAARPPI